MPHHQSLSPKFTLSIIALDSTGHHDTAASSAHTSSNRPPKLRLLLPASAVSHHTVWDTLRDLRHSLLHLENAHVARAQRRATSSQFSHTATAPPSFGAGSMRPPSSHHGDASHSASKAGRTGDLRTLIQAGLLSLSHMEPHASPLLLLATTGDLQLGAADGCGSFDSILAQCVHADVRLSILHINATSADASGAAGASASHADSSYSGFGASSFGSASSAGGLGVYSQSRHRASALAVQSMPPRALGSVSDVGMALLFTRVFLRRT